MIKLMKIVAALIGVASGAPQYQNPSTQIPILKYENQLGLSGTYKWAYETGNGIQAEEEGYLKNPGGPDEAQVAQGCYSYTSPEGHFILVKYIADENGFRPKVNHLPPISEGEKEALLASHGCSKYRPGFNDDGPHTKRGREITVPDPYPNNNTGDNPGDNPNYNINGGPEKQPEDNPNNELNGGPKSQPETNPENGNNGGPDDDTKNGYPPNISIDLRLLASRREGKCELDKDKKPIRCYCPKEDNSDEYVPCEP